MPNISIKIENINEIRSAFAKAPALMAKNLDTAIKRSIFKIQGTSMRNTPIITGTLRASHRTTFSPLRGEVGPTAYYGIFVHEGTRFIKANPFLARAVQSENNEVQDNFKRAVQDTLDSIAKDTR